MGIAELPITIGRPAALGASTLCEAFQITAAERPDQVALRSFGSGTAITFAEYAQRVRAIAAGLHALGVHLHAEAGRGGIVSVHPIGDVRRRQVGDHTSARGGRQHGGNGAGTRPSGKTCCRSRTAWRRGGLPPCQPGGIQGD
jgi:hypothetical protein